MISPFICYIISFVAVLSVYLLGWSDLYPKLSPSLIIFLLITFIAQGASHYYVKKVPFRKIQAKLPVVGTTIFIWTLWLIEFVYEGGIPLFKILLDLPYNYRLFGVPSVHVFVVTFASFFTIYLFHVYLSHRSKLVLILYFLNLSAAILIYNRGMLFFNLTGSVVVYLMSMTRLSYKRIAVIAGLLVPLFFLFGVLGSLRVSREANEPYNNDDILDTGNATDAFRQSFVPNEFFWTYVYVSSPLANLQHNINENAEAALTPTNLFRAGMNECLPDFITKRIHALHNTQPPDEYRIQYSLNASTVYSRAYSYARWGGLFLVGFFLIAFPWLFLKVIRPGSDFFITGWAILCTMYLFSSFENTFRFTGLSFQLVYPVILSFVFSRFGSKNQ
jgi:hypothetical protein